MSTPAEQSPTAAPSAAPEQLELPGTEAQEAETEAIGFEPEVVAALRAGREAAKAESTEETSPEAPKSPEPPPKAIEKPPAPVVEDDKLERVLQRLQQAEADKLAQAQELKTLREKAAKADEYEAEWANAGANPGAVFKRAKWTPQDIENYVKTGVLPKNPEIERVSKDLGDKTTKLEQELAELRAWRANQEGQAAIQSEKTQIAKELKDLAEKHPFTFARFENETEMVEEIFGVMVAAYQDGKRILSTQDVLSASEEHWAKVAERLTRASSKSPDPKPAKTTPATKVTTKPTTPPESEEDDGMDEDERDMARAVAYYRQQKSATQ